MKRTSCEDEHEFEKESVTLISTMQMLQQQENIPVGCVPPTC